MNDTINAAGTDACVTESVQTHLRATRPWVRLASILTFVAAGFMLIVGLVVAAVGLATSAASETAVLGAAGSILIALFYAALALVYVFPGLYLFRYADAIDRVLRDRTAESLAEALKHQRLFWRFVGILMVIGMVLGVLGMAAAMMVPAFLAMGNGTRI